MTDQTIQTTVGGPGWQRTYTAPIIQPKPIPRYETETTSRRFSVSELAHLAYEHPELFKAQYGRDYDIRDLGKLSYEHPEYFTASAPMEKPTVSHLERNILSGKYGEKALWEYVQATKIPKGSTLTGLKETTQGVEASYTEAPEPQYSPGEVWLQGMTFEDIQYSFFLRNLWDPEYKRNLAQRQQQFRSTHNMQAIQRQQTQQGELAASIAIIGFAAYDIGRSLYHIAKWGGAKGPATIDLVSKELQEEPFTYTQISGAKGSRATETLTYTPKETKPETFTVTSTRGTWPTQERSTRLITQALKDTKASTTLPQLMLWRELSEIRVPIGLYHPRFLTELTYSGIGFGSLLSFKQSQLTTRQQRIGQRLRQPERLFEKQNVRGIIRTRQTPAISQILGSVAETETMQTQGLNQVLAVHQPQRQLQRQKQLQKQIQQNAPRLPRLKLDELFKPRRTGKKSGRWWLKQHELPQAKTLVQRYVTGKGKRHRNKLF